MEPNPYGNSGAQGYGGYPQRPVSVFWSKARIQVKRYYLVMGRFGWVLPVTVSMGVCVAAWAVSQMPPDYISEAEMMVTGSFQLKEGAAYVDQMDNFYGTQIKLMQSPEVQRGAMARVMTLHPELPTEPFDAVTLNVNQEPHASFFNLSFEAQNALYAQAYLEAVMEEYIEAKKKLRLEKSDSTTVGIQELLGRLDTEISANDQAMHDFQKANNIGFLQQEGNDAAVYLAKLNRQLADLKIEFNLLQMLDLDQNLDRERNSGEAQPGTDAGTASSGDASKPDSDSLSSMGPVSDYQKAKQSLDLLKAQRAELSHNLRPAHPTIVALDQDIEKENDLIATLRTQSVEALKTRRDSIQIQMQNLQGVITEWEAKALDLSGRISEFDRIKTKSDRAKEEEAELLTNMNSVTVTKNVDQDSIMISEHASIGESLKPGWVKIILAGFGGGLLVGLLILFCIDQLDDRVSSFLELQTHFQNPILGQIPHEQFKDDSLLRHNDDRLALLEAFRSLRSSLIYFPVEGARPKTLIVTSALPNEGKTTISANLAITLAFSGARTLVVDADTRRGKLSGLFGITEGEGLSSILLSTMPWQDVVHQTTIDNLAVIACGPPLKYPAEHLLGKVADQFLKDIYEQYDYVIFDSPPVTLLDDTLSLAPKIDGALVVVRFGVSSVRTTRRTIDLLAQRQTNILGLICNDVGISESEYNYGYYYRQTIASYSKEIRASA